MADGQALPPFRPLPQKEPDIEMVRKPDGTIYLTPRQAPGDRPKTIPHCLDERASEHPDRVWLKQRDPQTDEWRALTYGEGKKKVDSLAQALLDMGAGPDAPVMILSGNSIESALVILAAQKIGAPAAPISVPYSTMSSDFGKLKHCFGAVKPKAIFVQQVEPFKPALDALGDHGCTVFAKEGATNEIRSFDELAATEPTAAVSEAMSKLNDDSVAKYLFTSGSTGMPKPVPTTQGAMCSMIAGQDGLRDDERDPDYDPDEVHDVLDWLPWNHISGSNVNFNGALWNGATFWIDGGKPTPQLFGETIRNIREVSPSSFGTAPIALSMLADAMEHDDDLLEAFFKNMRSIGYGGATLSDDLYDRLQALAIKATGKRIPIVTMYGATETQGITVVHWVVDRVGLIGLPLPGMTLKLVPNGSKMEVRVKGPSVMSGYLNMPEKNAETFDEEGYYKLGDAAIMVDENDPNKGIIFDGRVGEDFKLSTGTWVSVGTLRPDLVAACSPLVFDAVLTGQDKDFAGAMFWPSQATFETYVKEAGGDMQKAFIRLTGELTEKVRAFNAKEKGSSRRIKRFLVMTEPPSIDAGEITDKGYVNQRAVIDRRTDLVKSIYTDPPGPGVVEP
ncbi:AMP-binding protein [Henriciella mobilis]|uniref:Acyl-CoA synthetase n=1 Tax=Henriciella mobilis TaxID=2305467 RepID=A0A399RF94_9PROT|nr:AMP-binding protein [Henriciella mobilis]RIJ18196.1 acyl-CoA synthetase [Henriciella mobilis]RIJ24998.1 acyl-CoA synthetase [Henriciella mobilis]RIJ30058.1 acyl-CoA synthetase [Henriciella mobilis]